jgi:hypothetical protein
MDIILVTLAGCTGSGSNVDDGSPPGTETSTVDVLADAFGGREALEGLTGFTYDATGSRSFFGQGQSPDDGASPISDFDLVVSDERATNSVRYTWDRSQGGVTFASYDETCVKRVGVVDGIDNLLFGVSTGDMPSSRWAAVTKQHRMLNPQLIAMDALADPTLLTAQPDETIDEVTYHVVRFADPIAPIDFLVDASTGTLDWLRTIENDHLRRDVSLEVHYTRWKTFDVGAALPRELTLSLAGEVLHEESRSSLQVNPELSPDTFSFPAGSDPEYDEELAEFGARSSQYHEQGTSLGFVLDVPQLAVVAAEIVPGIDLLLGATHNSLVVEQADGIVVIEAPLYPVRGESDPRLDRGPVPGGPGHARRGDPPPFGSQWRRACDPGRGGLRRRVRADRRPARGRLDGAVHRVPSPRGTSTRRTRATHSSSRSARPKATSCSTAICSSPEVGAARFPSRGQNSSRT